MEQIVEAFHSIEDLADLKSFIMVILKAQNYFGDPFDDRFAWLLSQLNYVQKYIDVVKGNRDQIEAFDAFLEQELSDYAYTRRSQVMISQLVSLGYHLHPERLLGFIDQIRGQYANRHRYLNFALMHSSDLGYDPLDEFNEGALTVFKNLSDDAREQILEKLKLAFESYESYDSDSEERDGDDDEPPPVSPSKRHHRNLETLLHLTLEPKLRQTIQQLRAAKTRLQVIRTIDRYFGIVGRYIGNGRGGYSFAKIIAMGEAVQSELEEYLDDNKKYWDLYGSAPNGKADLPWSDKDGHFSPEAQMAIFGVDKLALEALPFSVEMGPIVRHFREKPQVRDFWRAYRGAEKAVARLSGQTRFHEGKVLTHAFPYQDWPKDYTSPMFYNPFVVRVNANRVSLLVYRVVDGRLKLALKREL